MTAHARDTSSWAPEEERGLSLIRWRGRQKRGAIKNEERRTGNGDLMILHSPLSVLHSSFLRSQEQDLGLDFTSPPKRLALAAGGEQKQSW